jgi:2'-5' RNA ligase
MSAPPAGAAGAPAPARTRRLFFALWQDEATRAALHRSTRAMARHSGGKPVPPENFHLTLAFLGSVPEARCPDVLAAGAQLSLPQLTLLLDRFGYFQAPQVLWIGPSVDTEELRAFVGRLWQQLAAAHAPADVRPFHPHVSIARKVSAPPQLAPPRPVSWAVSRFALVESETHPAGARYRVVAEFPPRV